MGLYDYRARYYDPALGRFISPDPIVPEPGNPQALNRYGYVNNNPLRYTDPSGHALTCGWGEGGCESLPPPPPHYSPSAANTQALWILTSWFFEIGPEEQWYGPESPFTQILMHHVGVQRVREEWAAAGYPLAFPAPGEFRTFRIEETASTPLGAYVQENVRMLLSFGGFGSPTPEGPINPLGGILGSYDVQITNLGDGTALFLVKNETDWASGTRIPGQPYFFLPGLERSETDVFINLALTADIFLLPTIVAAPETIPVVLALNRGAWELSKAVPGGWGGFGGTMTQYYYWIERIPGQ
ncbi:MAG: RHS repeat-associated core domain-containing protein [Thermoflexales bacterium]|nr:RHS repeat-associated core domain-containing protein [Thermoflexales bacterium]